MPGTSGLLTPFGKMDGLYFDDSMEPDDFLFNFKKSVQDTLANENVSCITVDFENKEDYYRMMNMMRIFNDTNLKVSSTSRENDTSIVITDEVDLDDKEKK